MLITVFFAQYYDYGFSPYRGGRGFAMALHHNQDVALMGVTDVDISVGHRHKVLVTPVVSQTSNRSISRFAPDLRGCYSSGANSAEFEFRHLPKERFRCSFANCVYAASTDKVVGQCGCLPLTQAEATTVLAGSNSNLRSRNFCKGPSLGCARRVLKSSSGFRSALRVDGQLLPCLQNCDDTFFR